jgi:hypothetical protein
MSLTVIEISVTISQDRTQIDTLLEVILTTRVLAWGPLVAADAVLYLTEIAVGRASD